MTPTEARDLADAISHNCACEYGIMGVQTTICGPHSFGATDPNIFNRLLFWRRQRERLLAEEATA